jgi:hypothetical protein
MRNIDTSEWLTAPRLVQIVATSKNKRRMANFTLRGSQKPPKKQALDTDMDTGSSEDAS